MVKRYELGSEWCSWAGAVPAMVEDPTGDYVLHEDYAKGLALIAEMADTMRNYQPCCLAEYDERVALIARAEELLK